MRTAADPPSPPCPLSFRYAPFGSFAGTRGTASKGRALNGEGVPAKRRRKHCAKQNKFMHCVYILISKNSPDKIYIGCAEDPQDRLKQHNRGDSIYTKQFAPWGIETLIEFRNKSQAYQFEKYLKSGSGFAFLKKRLLP